ncbi:MAG: fibronectin type III domain-containing protein [Acidimicrobiaceae bacterium]|nr:fibronectin type III domain-containing protein [Acidimicrobiaceae bacterium]
MSARFSLRRRLRGGTVAFAVLALIAAVLAPTAAAQSRSIGTVVIANGWSSADSAVASALAALESDSRSDAVVLYATRRELPSRVANFIEDHDPSEVILVGGTAALSSNVQADAADIVGSSAVRRIEGRDRFDTAAKAVPSTATTFIVANGYSAADTGVAAALAATRDDAAVLLAEADSLTEPTERIIREQQPLAVEFVGGTAVLAAELADRVQELAPSIRRVPRHSGASRTATAAAAAPNRSTTLVIANGWSPADMGVAAAYAAITSNAAVLYSETDELTTPTENRIRALAPRALVLVGGSAALDTSLHARLRTLAPAATIHRISGSDRIDTAVRAADGRLTEIATDPPAAPTSLTVTPRNAGLDVSWLAPTRTTDASSNDDPEVTGYAIQYRVCTAADETCRSGPRWGTWRSFSHSGTRTSTTISGLTNGTAYQVQVRARNSAGLGPWSVTETGTPLAQTARPSVPSGLTVEAANRLLKVSWSPAIPPRNGTVSGYEVEYRRCPTSTTCSSWIPHSHSGTGTTTTITRLVNGISYEVRVQATSSRGDSGWSPSRSATPALLPGFERPPDLTPGDRQILVQWNEPADSGSPIRDYDVQYRACTATDSDTTDLTCDPDDEATWGAWRSGSHSGTAQISTITGLTNGTAYQVEVRASNSNGAGPWSGAAKETPISVPAQPSTPILEPGNEKLVVTWTAPSDNGRAISGYDVEYCTGTCASDSTDWSNNSHSGIVTKDEITSLTNGTTYKVRVRAVNNLGEGPWSPVRSAAPKAVPDAPDAPVLTPRHREIGVSWDPPTDLHGTTITGYDIQYRACTATPKDCTSNPRWGNWRSKGHPDTDTLESTITGLTNATKYEVRVRAKISGGFGPYSEATPGTPLGKPSKPSTPKVTAGDGELMVTWTAPANNGSAITDYRIEHCQSTADCNVDTNWDEDTSLTVPTPDPVTDILMHTLSELTNGTTYRIRLLATNDQGDSPWSSTVSGTPTVRPDAPTNLTMNVADRQVALLWNAANDKGVALTGYDIQYRACATTSSDADIPRCDTTEDLVWGAWKTHSHSGVGISATITGLINGTKYEARVRARNRNGAGPWSEPYASGVPLAAASTPTGLSVEAAHERLSVSWTASAPHGSTITGYVMQHRECLATPKSCTSNARWSDWTAHSDVGDGTNRTIPDLTNGTKYQVRVQATSRTGNNDVVSGWSQIKSATPAAVPDAPSSSLALTADDRQITVTWTPPTNNGAAITDYDVEFRACTATDGDTTIRTCATEPTWGAWLPHSHSGASTTAIIVSLTNGTKYQMRVRATNANGVGPWSVPSATDGETPIGAPAMPTTPRVTAGNAKLTVDWITPRSNGSTINGYEVEYRACTAPASEFMVHSCASNPTWGAWLPHSHSGTGTTATIGSLTNGTAYQVQVRATAQDDRIGPWSSPVTAMPIGAPRAPATVELASGNRALYVSWTAPVSNGATVTGFKVRYCISTGNCHPSTGTDWRTINVSGASRRTQTIGSLANDSTYAVEVLTTSRSKGESSWSNRETAKAGGPNRVSPPRLTADSQQIGVTWTAPGQNHSPITGYDIKYRACTATDSVTTVLTCASNPTWGIWTRQTESAVTTATIPSLTSGTRYQVRVRAVNTQGAGQWSAVALATPTS